MYIIFAVVALGILILVHETGHFLAAKLCGVYVERFSIGFGPRLFSWWRGGTEYCLSIVPLGGYVKLHRMLEEEDVIEGKENEAFFNKSYPKKMLIITAGVIFNMLFAVLLISSVFMIGYKAYSPVVHHVEEGGAGESAGFLPGDRILAVNDKAVRSWEEFLEALEREGQYPSAVRVSRQGESFHLHFVPRLEDQAVTDGAIRRIDTGLSVLVPPMIGVVMGGFPADKAGVKAGDTVISVNGRPVTEWKDIGAIVQASSAEETLGIVVNRKGEELTFHAVPKESQTPEGTVLLLGISASDGDIKLRETPWSAFYLGAERTWDVTKAIYAGLAQLVSGKIAKENLGGPILILQEGSNSAKAGLIQYLFFMALISINLGVLNLLPIPVLDGGHVVIFTYERITSRRIGMRAREKSQAIGLFLLGCLMVFAFYNDITRFFK